MRIITHDGIFHADEIFAIALLHEVLGNCPVERTRNISAVDYTDVDVWIVDVGGIYDPQRNLFDHHHDKNLHASCTLVLNELMNRNLISMHLYEELYKNFHTISQIDCNGFLAVNGFQVNSLVKSFNSLPDGFNIALELAKCYIKAAIDTVNKIAESEEIWERGEDVSRYIKLCDAFPIHWKRYNDHMFLIYPNSGKWNLLSIDSEDFPIVSNGAHEFLHNGKFIAVYADKEDAIASAQLSAMIAVG